MSKYAIFDEIITRVSGYERNIYAYEFMSDEHREAHNKETEGLGYMYRGTVDADSVDEAVEFYKSIHIM